MLATFLSYFLQLLESQLSILFAIECSVKEVNCITPMAAFSTKFNNDEDPFNFRSLRGKESRIRFIRLKKLIKCYLVCSLPLAGSHLSQSIPTVVPKGTRTNCPCTLGVYPPPHVPLPLNPRLYKPFLCAFAVYL